MVVNWVLLLLLAGGVVVVLLLVRLPLVLQVLRRCLDHLRLLDPLGEMLLEAGDELAHLGQLLLASPVHIYHGTRDQV